MGNHRAKSKCIQHPETNPSGFHREGKVTCSKNEVNKKLQEVIDGEVSSREWKRILPVLPVGNVGSRVVRITQTRPEPTPAILLENISIVLLHLRKDDTTQMFVQTVSMDDLPISVADMSGMIEMHFQHHGWFAIGGRASVGPYADQGAPCRIEHVLKSIMSIQPKRLDKLPSMCFDDLPHGLKPCFLYFAVLPQNTPIKSRTSVRLWMAEGFLIPKEGKTMEKVGYSYLKELIDRHLVNVIEADKSASSTSDKLLVAAHDHVHAFLRFQAQEACFMEIHSGDDVPALMSARRLSAELHRQIRCSSRPFARAVVHLFYFPARRDY